MYSQSCYLTNLGAGRGAVEPEPAPQSSKDDQTSKAGKTSIGFTGVMTHDRFSPFSTVKDFKPKDIISIGK